MEDNERSSSDSKQRKIHPQDRSNILSRLCFCWQLPMLVKGLRKDLCEEDLYGPLKIHESKRLGNRLETAWLHEKQAKKAPSLKWTLFKVYWSETVLYVFFALVQELLVKMGRPLLIGELLSYYAPNQTHTTLEEAYFYAMGLIALSVVNMMIQHSVHLGLQHLSLRIQKAVCSLIYRKCLVLSKGAMIDATAGQVVNLMSNDVYRINYIVVHLHHIIVAPAQAFVVIYLLYTTLNISAMSGVVFLLAFIPIQLYMGKRTGHFRYGTAVKSDERIRLMNEILNGIQAIKMYNWEKPFATLIASIRSIEMKYVRGNGLLRSITVAFSMFLTRFALYLCILAYILTGHSLEAEYVYVLTSFYDTVRQPLTVHLPRLIAMLAEINTSLNRIQDYLLCEEVSSISIKHLNSKEAEVLQCKPIGVELSEATVNWDKSGTDCALNKITLSAKPGQLVAVIGPVGSGKTTLLETILQELSLDSGTLDVSGRIAYAPQEPWLFSSSIRQNIIFGQAIDQARYKKVVEVCALDRDFAILPHGDRTIVGDKGAMLSGGQKARINLARAIYKEADVYLLDDPLSAVDANVGKKLFDNCICDYLKEKCTILVTHQLQYLKNADNIYLLENGGVLASGTYSDLQNANCKFVDLLEEETQPQEDEEIETVARRRRRRHKSLKVEAINLPVEIKERRSTGTLSKQVYLTYYRSGGSLAVLILVPLLFLLTQVAQSGADYFLTFWVNLEQAQSAVLPAKNHSVHDKHIQLGELSNFFTSSQHCLYVYSAIVVALVLLSMVRAFAFIAVCMRAARKMHDLMFERILNATMRFFNINTAGRILNRFSKDMGAVDEALPFTLNDTLQLSLNVFSITIMLTIVNIWILIPTIVIFVLFYCYKCVFLATSRDLKRIEGTSRSPIFSHVTASMQGLSVIRAFGAQKILRNEFDHHQDLNTAVGYLFMACSRAFAFWLDVNSTIYIGIVILSFLFIGKETYGGNVGLAITQSISLTGILQRGMRQWSELENDMTSVERVVEYTQIKGEEDSGEQEPPQNWPSEGHIQFDAVSMKHFPDGVNVLDNLTFEIQPGEKIGIVGRTGAGKSSLVSALFRLGHVQGRILIDGVDSKQVPLGDLRSRISIIPQEPVLFSGTLRKNLDPFEEFDDSQLWNALDEVELKEYIADFPQGLSTKVLDGGCNFSVGQRQLLCLARTLVKINKILILDEATASIDAHTDDFVQNTIRKRFKECTVLTIAHRLHTIMDSDKILVIDAGKMAQFGHPWMLLQEQDGIFYNLVQKTGRVMAEHLTRIAHEHFNGHHH